jgi:hypothetical protein
MPNDPIQPEEERRQYKRINRSFILSYFDLAEPDYKFEITQIKNISLGGMCFVATKDFDNSVKLGLELKTPYLSGTTYMEGAVVGSVERMKDKIYETRIQFDPLEPEAKVLLQKLIDFFIE